MVGTSQPGIRTNNWSECGCLIKLFVHCPMTVASFTDNVEVRHVYELIKQLSSDHRIDMGIRNVAAQTKNKWFYIILPVLKTCQ